jgi:hypothetical protein
VLSDSGGKAPVVSFIFEPKVSHERVCIPINMHSITYMLVQLLQYESALMYPHMACVLRKFKTLIHAVTDISAARFCLLTLKC